MPNDKPLANILSLEFLTLAEKAWVEQDIRSPQQAYDTYIFNGLSLLPNSPLFRSTDPSHRQKVSALSRFQLQNKKHLAALFLEHYPGQLPAFLSYLYPTDRAIISRFRLEDGSTLLHQILAHKSEDTDTILFAILQSQLFTHEDLRTMLCTCNSMGRSPLGLALYAKKIKPHTLIGLIGLLKQGDQKTINDFPSDHELLLLAIEKPEPIQILLQTICLNKNCYDAIEYLQTRYKEPTHRQVEHLIFTAYYHGKPQLAIQFLSYFNPSISQKAPINTVLDITPSTAPAPSWGASLFNTISAIRDKVVKYDTTPEFVNKANSLKVQALLYAAALCENDADFYALFPYCSLNSLKCLGEVLPQFKDGVWVLPESVSRYLKNTALTVTAGERLTGRLLLICFYIYFLKRLDNAAGPDPNLETRIEDFIKLLKHLANDRETDLQNHIKSTENLFNTGYFSQTYATLRSLLNTFLKTATSAHSTKQMVINFLDFCIRLVGKKPDKIENAFIDKIIKLAKEANLPFPKPPELTKSRMRQSSSSLSSDSSSIPSNRMSIGINSSTPILISKPTGRVAGKIDSLTSQLNKPPSMMDMQSGKVDSLKLNRLPGKIDSLTSQINKPLSMMDLQSSKIDSLTTNKTTNLSTHEMSTDPVALKVSLSSFVEDNYSGSYIKNKNVNETSDSSLNDSDSDSDSDYTSCPDDEVIELPPNLSNFAPIEHKPLEPVQNPKPVNMNPTQNYSSSTVLPGDEIYFYQPIPGQGSFLPYYHKRAYVPSTPYPSLGVSPPGINLGDTADIIDSTLSLQPASLKPGF